MSIKQTSTQERLERVEAVARSFDLLVGWLADLMAEAKDYRARGAFDAIALLKYTGNLSNCILASGHDPRVIRMCQVMLELTDVSEKEIYISDDGVVVRRQVYFAQRSDGLVKIGSTMDVKRRMKQLSAGAAEDLVLLGHIDGSTPMEMHFHEKLKACRKHGEWFEPTDYLMEYVNSFIHREEKANSNIH